MTYPNTADLERELVPVVIRCIRSAREEQGLSLSYAIRAVARDWYHDALNQGFSGDVADDAVRFVHRVGAELQAQTRDRSS